MFLDYPVVSADPKMLRLAALKTFEHIAPALDPAIGCGCVTGAEAEEGLKGGHWLLSAVVAEHEFVEVRLELRPADAVVGANQPVLQVTDDTIGKWHDGRGSLAERRPQRLLERDVPIPGSLQPSVGRQTVGVEGGARGDVRLNDGAQGGRGEIRQDDEADATRTVITPLNGDENGHRATVFQLTASRDARLRTANPGVVELDLAMEGLSSRVDHRSAQLVEHHPRRFVAPQAELALDQKRRDTAPIRGHQVRRPEPLSERSLRVVQNRPGRQRDLMPTVGALPAAMGNHVSPAMTAVRANEALWPPT